MTTKISFFLVHVYHGLAGSSASCFFTEKLRLTGQSSWTLPVVLAKGKGPAESHTINQMFNLEMTYINSLYNSLTSICHIAPPTIRVPGNLVLHVPRRWKAENIWQTAVMTNYHISILSCYLSSIHVVVTQFFFFGKFLLSHFHFSYWTKISFFNSHRPTSRKSRILSAFFLFCLQ